MRSAAHIVPSTAVAVARIALLTVAACFAVTVLAQPSPPTTAADAGGVAKRPKIGLVLSGGGARGIAHIGVLKVMEEMRIPVDYLAATSMGSIVGGLYASGMSPAKMQEVVTSVNWATLFSDSPPRRELGLRDKQRDTRFPLPIEIGFRDGEIRGFQGSSCYLFLGRPL
jgi:NTE family protein